jgi:transposase-like protein
MSPSKLNLPQLQDEAAARKALEAIRWPDGPVCSHCGSIGRAYTNKSVPGRYRCAEKECRKDFTVTTGTVMERSHIPLHKWLQAYYLLCSSKKGMSSKQVERTLGVTYKTAWFLTHRIREAMREGGLVPTPPMGGKGKIVEVDETFIGRLEGQPKKRRSGTTTYKNTVLALVERGGPVRTFHVAGTTVGELVPIIRANVSHETRLMTDEGKWYSGVGAHFVSHETINHSRKEYVRGDISTNTVEGYFGIFKRGMRGVYQHCKEKHLHRYLAEFEFRYNHRVALGVNDMDRTFSAIKGSGGKRLTYHQANAA